MQLLISVRSAEEVGPALAGGADIIDAKEPNRGSLGHVDRNVLSEIIRRVPDHYSISVALGDLSGEEKISAALDGLVLPTRKAATYLKLGFAGVLAPNEIQRLLQLAVAASSSMAARPRLVAVAYADSDRAGTVPAKMIPSLALAAGATGVLLDTHGKDGLTLLHWVTPARLADWVAASRQMGLLTALAGGLRSSDLAVVCQAQPEVIGFRGAACRGGRWGRVSAHRVRQLDRSLEWAEWGRGGPASGASVGETRETGAISSLSTAAKSRKLKA